MIRDIDDIFSEVMEGIEKEAKEQNLAKEVYDYLASDYPKKTLDWVNKGEWSKGNIPLEKIKMGRRPGGARESKKTKALEELYKKNEKVDPIVLVLDGKGEYRIADGYHRTLARKNAGFDSIEAYVMKTDEESGPWIFDMHDQKISKGVSTIKETFQKNAYEEDHGYGHLKYAGVKYLRNGFNVGLDKQANKFLKPIKSFTGYLTGSTKKKTGKALEHAKQGYKNFRTSPFNVFAGETAKMKNDMGKSIYDYAKSEHRDAKRKTLGARAAVAGTGMAALGGSKVIDNVRNQPSQEEFQQQREDLENQRQALQQQLQ